MEVNQQKKLTFQGVDILNVNFKAISPRKGEVKIDIKCVPKVFYPLENKNLFKIVMDMELKDIRFFEIFITAVGTFELDSELNEDLRKVFVNANAPAIMFPYIRSFITTLTANLGNVIGALVIPTQFFKGDLEELKELKEIEE